MLTGPELAGSAVEQKKISMMPLRTNTHCGLPVQCWGDEAVRAPAQLYAAGRQDGPTGAD